MTNLAISAAQFVGNSAVQVGASLAQAAASQAISSIFDQRTFEGPRLDSFHLQTSRDGAPMSRIYGRVRLAGQVIWASRIRETSEETRVGGGKGSGPTQKTYNYTISFAIGLCEGEILGVDRLWANGAPLKTLGLNYRVYLGTANQPPDPIIGATEGANVPAFRGTAYIVFEDFPLDGFGGRLPQINAEVVRVPAREDEAPRLESMIKSVNLLPGSGEYAYATSIVEETPRPGVSRPVNVNNLSGGADIELALDQLQSQLPNCKNVSIISAWFGTDLRCGECEIRPGVERRDRVIVDRPWQVGTDRRGNAYLISQENGRPNYGGTPSDESLIEAIRALKSRGLEVTLYPFLLMDIPPETSLPAPNGLGSQPAFPWRGRITSTIDRSVQTAQQINNFFDRAHGFKSYILSHARLAKRAGGVDRFIIGSEMRGLTTLRDEANNFPAVEKLADLANDVRAILGPQTGLTYAADWTEYFGYHPQDGSSDVYFHLDKLWAHPAIDAIGIDAYFPLSDWRENSGHADEDIGDSGYDKSYLMSQVEGGEGYDYFYGSLADRDAQNRQLITDGLAQKPWVFRYKDLRNWWNHKHYNRINGTEVTEPTSWQPQGKPFWLLEVGCPAIHNGAHQPNVFSDPKSSENKNPYYSTGYRDDLIQRNYLESLISYWGDPDNNPVSNTYSGAMIDTDLVSVWAWDARPFPDFPARKDVWSDGENWMHGHWINGRTGQVKLSSAIDEITRAAGLSNIDVTGVSGFLQGYHIDRPMSARAALTPLFSAFDLSLSERSGKLVFNTNDSSNLHKLSAQNFVLDAASKSTDIRADSNTKLKDVRLHFIDVSNDYQLGSVSARDRAAETERVEDARLPIVMDPAQAKEIARRKLTDHHIAIRQVSFALPPILGRQLRVGDMIQIDEASERWQINAIDAGAVETVSAVRVAPTRTPQYLGYTPSAAAEVTWESRPLALAFDLPGEYDGLLVGSIMSPFSPHMIRAADQEVQVSTSLWVGATLSPLISGPLGRWDMSQSLDIFMPDAALAGLPDSEVLSGANKFAVETTTGWEIIHAAEISLTGPNQYRLQRLLRGLSGSDVDMASNLEAGARIVFLDQGLVPLPLANDWIGEQITVTPTVAGRDGDTSVAIYIGRQLRPYAPVHLKTEKTNSAWSISWIRRSRLDGDSWAGGDVPLGEVEERYRVTWQTQDGDVDFVEVTMPFASLPLTAIGDVQIAQYSALFGWGAEALISLLH